MRVVDCIQGEPEWFEARRGIPTMSNAATILAKGKSGGDSLTRRRYMLRLAGERLTGDVSEQYSNADLIRGQEMEPEARSAYAFINDIEPELVGFCLADDKAKGCSPDALIGTPGLLEIKTALPHILIDKILKNEFPAEHVAQCQGNLWITEREWIDLCIYWPKLPLFIKRAWRDEKYISTLAKAVDRFNEELAQAVEMVQGYSGDWHDNL